MTTDRKVTIRDASLDDLAEIEPLCEQLGWHVAEDELKERLEYVLAHPDDYGFFVADVDGKVMGFANVILKMEINSGFQARVDGIVVNSDTRGLGLGRLLMDATEEWAKKHGSKSMKLVSNAKRIEAHKFYEKIGYENAKTQFAFKKKL